MPELPEVETSRLGILPHLKDQRIRHIIVRQPKLRWPVEESIAECQGHVVQDIQRRAKYLLLQLTEHWIVIHLGMSGRLRIAKESDEVGKHDHIDLVMENGAVLRYTDPRRFGSWLWCQQLSELSQFSNLGPEPLQDNFDADYLFKQLRSRKIPIKNAIMQSSVVVGVGNIYASESLFIARIHPEKPSYELTQADCARLVVAIKRILQRSIAQGGTTLKDFLQSDGKPGYFVQQLQVYGKAEQPCSICSHIIEAKKIGQRNTFYCPVCQQ